MEADDTDKLALALPLIAIAGSVDAIGFLKLRHLFVSFVSGDSTQWSVAVSAADWSTAASPGLIVAVFVAGVIGGYMIRAVAGAWARCAVLLSEALLLAVAIPLGAHPQALGVPMAAAMGLQNAVIGNSGRLHPPVTYVTGTLVRLGRNLAQAITGRAQGRWEWVPYLLLWLSLTAGAIAGAAAYRAFGLSSLLLPAIAVLALAAIEGAVRHRAPHPG